MDSDQRVGTERSGVAPRSLPLVESSITSFPGRDVAFPLPHVVETTVESVGINGQGVGSGNVERRKWDGGWGRETFFDLPGDEVRGSRGALTPRG